MTWTVGLLIVGGVLVVVLGLAISLLIAAMGERPDGPSR